MTHNRGIPDLSVVIITPDQYATIRKTVGHLQAQTVAERLEIVIVAPSTDVLNLNPEALEVFQAVRVAEVGMIQSTAAARAAGVREATAPVVAFAEDHSYPEPDWAEALIEAHRRPEVAVVGPVLGNANPATLTGWANLLIEYSPWLAPAEAGNVEHLPGHNSSYKRSILLEYDADLEAMLKAESILHWDLRKQGYQLYLEPAATTNHLNFSRPLDSIVLRFYGGRLFAAARSRRWSRLRRLLYAGAAPLIPLVRLRRILAELRKPGRPGHLLPRILPALIVGLIADGTGEMVGYISGAGDTMQTLTPLEFHREQHLSKHERLEHALDL